jgi:ring-1,2-phenylacetyl-CoA epoxidase subunit PaaB
MTDTQWPSFIVFQQAKVDAVHQYAGSVHAPDAEMALMNARDVFVRRPTCVSLWIVPAAAVFSKTAEELAEKPLSDESNEAGMAATEIYIIFQKATHKAGYNYTGKVNAPTPSQALAIAFETFTLRSARAWWIFPEQLMTHSTPEDIETLFTPALSKDFRDQAFYHTVAAMQQIKTRSQENSTDES